MSHSTLVSSVMPLLLAVVLVLAMSHNVDGESAAFQPLIRYCGVPPNKLPPPPPTIELPQGAEISLRQVIALIRHGDRTTSSTTKCWNNDTAVWNCTLTSTSIANTNQNQSESSVPRLFRLNYMNGRQLFAGNCQTGQLTSKGIEQQIRNGERAAETYIKSGFLSSYFNSSEIYIRSSEYSRTVLSAQGYITGMYPRFAANVTQIIDIQTIDRKRDDMLLNRDLCPRLKQYEEKALLTPMYLQHHSRYTQPLLRNLSTELGITITVDNLGTFHDCLNTHFCNGFEIPISTQQYLDVREETAYMEYTQYSYPSRAAFAQAGLGFLLREMVDFMQQNINGNTNPKFLLFSGHDSSIMPMLTAFDMWDGQWTPYAAQLTWEIYNVKASASAQWTYGVRLLYDGRAWPIRGCSLTVGDLCDWNSFLSLVAPLMPSNDPAACQRQLL